VRTAARWIRCAHALQVELQVDNAKRCALPRIVAEVHFKVPAATESEPAGKHLALRQRACSGDGLTAPIHVHLKPFVPGHDFGKSIEVVSGLAADDSWWSSAGFAH